MPSILVVLLGLGILAGICVEVLLFLHSYRHILAAFKAADEGQYSLGLQAVGFWFCLLLLTIAAVLAYLQVISGQIAVTVH